ncbi:MAG: hypothetical protein FWE12_08165 [Oscillospiraceae bacterium]|nr:hypothetical protein [Oscillospiraceae bacterium]
MQSILEEFFYGNISPEVQTFSNDSEFGKALALITRTEEQLLERLGADEKELLERYIDAQMELNRLTAMKGQLYGYKLGVLMTAEVFLTGREVVAGG